MDRLLRAGGSLTAYRSNPGFSYGPSEGSWAWRLERLAEQMFGIKHVIAVNSGTMALQAALHSLDLVPRSSVVTTPYTFSATAAAIIHAGHQPVFGDVHPVTYCLDPALKVPLPLGKGAVLPVDLFGRVAHPGQYAWGGPVIEDACQAVGAAAAGTFAGDFGVVGAYSFNGMKNVGAGEAGAAVTGDEELAKRMRRYVSHSENWGGAEVGLNGRLNELTACVAYHGLRVLPKNNAKRRTLALELWHRLTDEERVRIPSPKDISRHALYVYPLTVAAGVDRAAFVRRLKKMGIEAGEGYIRPHLGHYPAFKDAVRGPLPVVEELSEKSLVLLYQVRPPATVVHMRYIATAIRAALDAGKTAQRTNLLGRVEAAAF